MWSKTNIVEGYEMNCKSIGTTQMLHTEKRSQLMRLWFQSVSESKNKTIGKQNFARKKFFFKKSSSFYVLLAVKYLFVK